VEPWSVPEAPIHWKQTMTSSSRADEKIKKALKGKPQNGKSLTFEVK